VRKAPASTIGDLAIALKEIFNAKNEIKTIGTRHGEKLYETLVTREEMAVAKDSGDYFQIKADDRDLNYNKYFSEGQVKVSKLEDYNSHNTERLDVPQIKKLLDRLFKAHPELHPQSQNQQVYAVD
jgi:UDP-glucose 4-epimerase